MRDTKIGIIGYGGFGQFLRQAWEMLPSIKVTAVSKRSLSPGSLGEIKVYPCWPDLVSDPEIDLVAIATPPNLHAEIACAALDAGKHVLIEKPLATTIQDAVKILEARNRSGRVATVNFLLRYNPIVEALIEISHSKVLGELRRIDVENYASDSGLPPSHWFWDQEVSGGIFIEHGVHFIDLANQLTSQVPKVISGFSHYRNPSQEDQVMANILYDGGLMATHYHHFARPNDFEETSIKLSFDLGQLDIFGWVPLTGRLSALVDVDWFVQLARLPGFVHSETRRGYVQARFGLNRPKQQVYAECARRLISDLLCAISDPAHNPRVSLEDGLTSLTIAKTAREASRQVSHPVVHTNGVP